jgi:sulfatase maturation enzyme AslB (radical SAM superfamily)
MPNDKFCVRPFMHSLVDTEGRFKPCCRSQVDTGFNIKSHTVEEWWNSEYLNDFRDRIKRNEYSKECDRCYRQEQQGSKSFREYSNERWPDVKTTRERPIDWEIQLSNLCNLKCLMCNPQSSSQFLVEENKLFGKKWDQTKYDWDAKDNSKILEIMQQSESFILRGGEPFMLPWVKDIISSLADRKEIMIATNGTRFDQSWLDVLSGHDIKICLSLDGHGKLNHYIRYPSKWNDILDNIKLMRKIPGVNLFVNTVVQNLNVLHIDRLLDWTKGEELFVQFDILTKPKYLEPSCLPAELAKLAQDRLGRVDHQSQNGLEGIINTLDNATDEYWEEFVETITIRDRHRGVDIVNYIPEMEPYFA